jgi:membrane protease YdiL (CAAX protease family)
MELLAVAALTGAGVGAVSLTSGALRLEPSGVEPVLGVEEAGMVASLAAQRPVVETRARGRVLLEVTILLTITLGMSGWQAILDLAEAYLRPEPISAQAAPLVQPLSWQPWIDLARQLAWVVTNVAWGAMALYLLVVTGTRLAKVGLDRTQVVRDVVRGVVLAIGIGLPGLAFYFAFRAMGLALDVQPSTLTAHWWTVPVLLLSAAGNAFVEESIVVAYLVTRLRQVGWRWPAVIIASCLLRGSYHLYQGWGGFFGNILMGLIFLAVWLRTRRLAPLMVAHFVMDAAVFIGYAALAPHVGWL